MSIEMMHLLKDQLKQTSQTNDKDYCMNMMFLIKFKIYYNFINENNDINYVETNECLNLTRVRDTFNRFNDTFHHIQYIPKVKQSIDLVTYQIYTWLVFALVTLIILYAYIRFEILIKKEHLVIQNKKGKSQNVIEVNEGCAIESSNTTNIQEVIEDLNEIVNLDE